MSGYDKTARFMVRLVLGLIISIFVGNYIDDLLNCKPLIMLLLMGYTIIGSICLLIKEVNNDER